VSQELLVFQIQREAAEIGEEANNCFLQECETHIVDVLFPPGSGFL
jgi:hypothetical protein